LNRFWSLLLMWLYVMRITEYLVKVIVKTAAARRVAYTRAPTASDLYHFTGITALFWAAYGYR
jgi:hypothetical protein